MSISIQTNVDSMVAQRNLNTNSVFESKTIQQLTSGYRINSSGDDAAGLAIANSFRSSEAELTQGVANANDGISTLQIVDGGMSNVSNMLDRLRTLATQSASQTFTGDRSVLNNEFQGLLTEINRQAQSIGMNQGGVFAQALSVYIGGGKNATTGAFDSRNGTVNFDLSNSSVDTQALGLTGMQVTAGTADLSASSTTSVANILANNSNTEATSGYALFNFAGPGFSDGSQIGVSVNLSGVTDIGTLASAINTAITAAGNGNSAAATAFKNAGVVATVNTDANGGEQLAFKSSVSAFQVQAGDQMSNALMGNLSSGTLGTAISTTTASANTTAGALANPTTVKIQIADGGLTSPVTLTLASGDTTTALALSDIQNQVANNSALKAAGITASGTAGSPLVFTNAQGNKMNVMVTGDTADRLGMGSFVASGSGTQYTTITAGTAYDNTAATGVAKLEFSINGGASNTHSISIDLAAGDASTDSRTTQNIADALNSAFAADSTLTAAGLQATVSNSKLVVTSSNGTEFRLSAAGSAAGADLGFGVAGATFSGATVGNSAATFNDANGTSNTGALTFNAMAYGNDNQTVTIAATNATGALESKTVTLQNNGTAQTGQSVDQAVAYINQQLQKTNNPTLQSIVAVKENAEGTEKINFLSSLKNFTVSFGSSLNDNGFGGAAGSTVSSTQLGTTSSVSIDTQENASQALSAVATAVTKLGTAQAAVGKGQNQLNYAIGLAQSQITNYSAAESRIRDADVAKEAGNLTKAQVLQQASIAAMAQANSEPQALLSLLKG